MDIIKIVASELTLKESSVNSAIKLLDEGNTVPFIARYRKEATGNLTDTNLRDLDSRVKYLRKVEERVNTCLTEIESQGKLTSELKDKFLNTLTLNEVEDLYRPYKPKRKTRASIAKEKGLEPLAKFIIEGKNTKDLNEYAITFVSEETIEKDPKKVYSLKEAIDGAKDIISEIISDEAKYREFIKKSILNNGFICSSELKKDENDTFNQYSNYKEKLSSIPSHRVLALNRGESLKCLKIKLDYEIDTIFDFIYDDYKNNYFKEIITSVINDSLKRLILPSVENEIRADLSSKAEDKSIIIFKKNLRSLLLTPPLKNKVILGFDPGFRTGCKYALVNEEGIMKFVGVSKITAASEAEVSRSINELIKILKNNKIDYIALGNGTASRESYKILDKIIKDNGFHIEITIVNESGASVYSASKLGESEYPDLTVEKRSAISLARRAQDPLSELVKIDPRSIGVGQYQHDMDQVKLADSLNGVVEDCVNEVGVNLNNASPSILKYVSGINSTLANNIYSYLKTNGKFKSREDLKNVKGMGEKSFEQCAGFLRIYDGTNPLDSTNIHPESYEYASYILKTANIDLKEDEEYLKDLKLMKFNRSKMADKFKISMSLIDELIKEIIKPARDIRDSIVQAKIDNSVQSIDDLKVGMILEGTVRNIMDFGMFIDINVHTDGLCHISEVSNKFVKDISSLYTVNDIVKVKVIGVDKARKRINLSIKQVK